jgi:Fibrobacter succinogenes major domain (Fib_succ_major).
MRTLFILVFICLFTLIGCSKEEGESMAPDLPIGEVVLDDKTYIVNESESSKTISVETDKIIFTENTLPKDIAVGSILISDITEAAPGGYLRKVTSIQTENEQTVVKTEQATLVEAIRYASVKNSRRITVDDILYIELSDGSHISQQQIKQMQVKLKSTKADWVPITFEKEVVIYDQDNNMNTKDDQIRIKGEITFQLTSEFDIDIDAWALEYLKMGVGFENESKLTISAELKKTFVESSELKLKIGTVHLMPFTFYVGIIPIPIADQSIDLVVGVDASVSAKLSTGFTCKNSISAGLEFKKGLGVKPVSSSENNMQYTPFDIKLQAKLEPYFGIYWRAYPFLFPEKAFIQAGPRLSFPIEATLGLNGGQAKVDWLVSLHMIAKLGFVTGVEMLDYDEKWEMAKGNIAIWQFIQTSELETLVPYNITGTTAMCGGHLITNFLDMQIQEQGICYVEKGTLAGTSLTTDDNSVKHTGMAVEVFKDLQMKDLKPNTVYQVRAYVKNQAGTIYGEIKEFTTSNVDGVYIGEQIWMTKNLAVTQFRNGDNITCAKNGDEWAKYLNERTPAYCDYEFNSANRDTHGLFYNRYAVTDSRKIAPVGWRIPTQADYKYTMNNLFNIKDFLPVYGGSLHRKIEDDKYSWYWRNTYIAFWWILNNESSDSLMFWGMENCNACVPYITGSSLETDGMNIRCVKE